MTVESRRVLLVSSSSGSHGGGELYLVGLAEGLRGLGHSVEVLLASHPRMDALAGQLQQFGLVHRASFPNTYDRRTRAVGAALARRTIGAVARRLAALKPDVIHLNKQNLEDGLDLLLAAGRTGLPSVCTIHVTRDMSGLGSAFGRVRDWVTRRVLARTRCEFVVVARAGERPFRDAVGRGVELARLHCVWNGIRAVESGDRAALRASWGCGPEHVVLGTVARLEPEKGPLFALELLARLPERVRYVWVGDGRQREAFVRRADELGVTGRIHLDGWRTDARQRLAGLDAFVLPSAYEFFPFAVLEAMAAGLPCVASDVGGIGEALLNGETGWLCEPRDADAWLGRLGQLIDSPELRARMGARGRERVAAHFSLESMARGTAAVYETAIRRTAERVGAP